MKLFKTKLRVLALAVGSLAITVAGANAQNTGFDAGDLVVGFQTSGNGSSSFVLANLGVSTTYRDATSNITNIIGVNSALTAQFGAGWADRADLFMGVFAIRESDGFSEDLFNGDAPNTIYVSAARNTAGVGGVPQSNAQFLPNDGNAVALAGAAMSGVGNDFETRGSSSIATLTNSGSFVDYMDQNPIGGTSYGFFVEGSQKAFSSNGTFGTIVGSGINAENAVDIYRYQNQNAISGQYGFGGLIGIGEFQGSVVIDGSGSLSFVAVPEPSTYALLGLGVVAVLVAVRRRKVSKLTSN